jgi:uncharacterized delta-60 repeat protein
MKVTGSCKSLYFLLVLLATGANVYGQTCVPASTAAGALDTCFDGDGRVTTRVTTENSTGVDLGQAVAVQADGKILAAGVADRDNSNSDSKFAVVRYNKNGSLDTSFDGDGIVITNFVASNLTREEAKGIAIQTDGKIVVAGYAELNTNNFAFALVRYNTDGSLDTSFDGDGKAVFDLAGNIDEGNALVIQPDGKIVVAGDSRSDRVYPIVARFNPDGSLDNTFDTDGWATFDPMNNINAVALASDGKILVAGNSGIFLSVARLNANGSLDTNFGTSGIAKFTADNHFDEAYALAVEANGKILAAGFSQTSQSLCAALVRFTSGGAIESSFVNCGESPGDMTINSMALQPDGKIVTAGYGGLFPSQSFQIVRYNTNLSVDGTFNGTGTVRVKFADGNNEEFLNASAVAIGRDNKIVAVGATRDNVQATSAKFAAVRIFSGLAAPCSAMFDFDGDCKADVSVFRRSTNVWYVFQSSIAQVTEQVFGLSNDVVAPADFDGDGKTDFAVFRPSTGDWWFKSSITGVFNNFHWGQQGDYARPSDFDGDGKADFIVFRWMNGVWYRYGSTGQISITPFGQNGDAPLVGDFDGDGKSDLAIYRPTTGEWWWLSSNDGIQRATRWGISTDIAVPADYDGDGKTDFTVFRPSNGTWYILNSASGQATIVSFGLQDDSPAAADYDGDGKADIAVFRPSTGVWYLQRSTAGFAAQQFGISNDRPAPSAFVPSFEFNVFH